MQLISFIVRFKPLHSSKIFWKLKLEVRLYEIADKYNTIINMIESTRDEQSKLHVDQLLYNVDVASYGKTEGSGESKDKFSDTPQGSLANVESGTYLTDYRSIETGTEQCSSVISPR